MASVYLHDETVENPTITGGAAVATTVVDPRQHATTTPKMFYVGKAGGGTASEPIPVTLPNDLDLPPGAQAELLSRRAHDSHGQRFLCTFLPAQALVSLAPAGGCSARSAFVARRQGRSGRRSVYS